MTASTITLNAGTGGDKPLVDTLTTVDGAAAPAGASAQMVKVGHGAAGDFKTASAANPLPTMVVDATASGTLAAAAQTVVLSMAGGLSSASVQITGTWAGTIQFEGTVDGTNWVAVNGVYAGASSPMPTISANGVVRLTPAGLASVRVNMTVWTSGTATISMRASDGVGGIFANQILPTKITNGTTDAGVEPFGAMQVNTGFATLFYDSWSVSPIDTTDKWTVTGTTPTIANGNMQMAATAATYNAIRTKDTVRPNVGFTLVRNGISIETAASTGAGRFWGLGTPATTPLPMVLAQDGIGYELDQVAGTLLAVTYAAGTRTTVATLTRPTDGLTHAYGLYFRVTQAYWILDGVTVASQSFPNVQIVELPALIVRQNAAAFTGTPVFTNIAHLTADTSRQSFVIADPVIGTRQQRVNTNGSSFVGGSAGAALALDGTDISAPTAMPAGGVGMRGWLSAIWTKLNGTLGVTGTFWQATQPVSLATNTPTIAAGTALMGKVGIDQTTPGSTNLVALPATTLAVTATAAANTGVTLTLPAAGAGLFHYITGIEIARNATAALAGTATLVITTTNLPGSLAWSVGNAMAAGGTQIDETRAFSNPFKSSVANIATTIVMPAPGAAVLWRANVYYYTGV